MIPHVQHVKKPNSKSTIWFETGNQLFALPLLVPTAFQIYFLYPLVVSLTSKLLPPPSRPLPDYLTLTLNLP
jgi:hypothetical protein